METQTATHGNETTPAGAGGIVSRTIDLLVVILGAVVIAAALRVASAQGTGPVIDSVTIRKEMQRYETIYPEFHFHDPSGTVRFIHREVTATNSPKSLTVQDGIIVISPEQQIKGAIFVGGWPCGPESYYLTIQAFLMNLEGQKSNVVEYTIHCNGG